MRAVHCFPVLTLAFVVSAACGGSGGVDDGRGGSGPAPTGGASEHGGSSQTGGASHTGGSLNTGGTAHTGGASSTGGTSDGGTATGGLATKGGAPSKGGSSHTGGSGQGKGGSSSAGRGGTASSGGVGGGSGVTCGNTTCGPHQVCCNPSCGICTAPDAACIQIVCDPPTGGAPSTGGASGSATCTTVADCRLFDDYCTGCNCRALAKGEKDPVCSGPGVQCIIAPCDGHSVACRSGHCVVE